MITVTYLDHSGFVVDREEVAVVFDYYRDPSDALKRILEANPKKPVLFFVSHCHEDHFNHAIFNMAQNHQRMYVLSDDINGNGIGDSLPVAWIHDGGAIERLPGNVSVRAFGSTDKGVSYYVTFNDGTTCFHAGDLNYWHWQDESTVKEVRTAYAGFVHEMQRIMALTRSIDIVFFPVDPRQGTDYANGARLFMENIDVANFFPMHFWGDASAVTCFEDYATDNTVCHALTMPGASVDIGDRCM